MFYREWLALSVDNCLFVNVMGQYAHMGQFLLAVQDQVNFQLTTLQPTGYRPLRNQWMCRPLPTSSVSVV